MSLFNYFKRTKFQFILVIVLTVINAGWQTLGGISSANALSAVAQMNGKQFFIWVGIMTLAYTFYAVFGNWITVSTAYLTQNIDTLIRTDVTKRLAAADYHSFHEQTTATYTSWLTNDINTINEFGIGDLMMIIQQISEISMSAVTLAYFHYSLLITTAILTIIMAVVPNLFTKLMAKRSLSFTHANERLVNTINDLLEGFNTLFLANAAQVIVNKINDACGDVKKHAVAYKKAAGASAWTTNLISFACQSILLAQAGWLILQHLTPVGTISGAQFFAGTIFAELSGISFNWQEFRSLKPIMAKLASVKTMPSKKEIPLTANSDISLDHISYTYPQKDKATLNNLAFSFKNKGKYILTGDSAAGKSTLLNIISGLIKNYRGKIFLGKQDYHNLSDRQFHQQISYVLQNPYIFNASLRWNLTLGEDFSIAELDRVLKECDLTATVAKLPQGLNTVLDSKGSSLSGGQKQRIAFARALLRKTPIYLLDEATSSLDKEASTQLEKQILTDPGKTVIMVTHHLQKDIANLADQIVDLQKINS